LIKDIRIEFVPLFNFLMVWVQGYECT